MVAYLGAQEAVGDAPPAGLNIYQPFQLQPLRDIEFDETTVSVDGFRLRPLSEAGIDGSAWELHPKAIAGLALDSNPLPSPGSGDSDVQARLGIGLELSALGKAGWRADLEGMLRVQEYAQTDSRDFVGGNARVGFEQLEQPTRYGLKASWERASEPIFDVPEQAERNLFQADVHAASEGRDTLVAATVGLSSLNYLTDTIYFSSSDRDKQRAALSLAGYLLNASNSLLGIELGSETVRLPDSTTANGHDGFSAVGRWRHVLGVRSSLDLRLGGELRVYDDYSAGLSANNDRTLLNSIAHVRLSWGWEEWSWVRLAASSALTDGATAYANASQRTALKIESRVRLQDRTDLLANGWVTRRIDTGSTAGTPRERADEVYLRLGLDYRLREGLGVRLWGNLQVHESSTGEDYNRLLVALEFAAAL